MADIRIPARPPAEPARPTPAARTEAIRAAQRAFFDTALAGEALAPPAVRPAAAPAATAAAVATAPPPREAPPVSDPGGPPPSRLLRPGSLVDIKV